MMTGTLYEELGLELRRARIERRLEQTELAERVGVTARTIRSWEAGVGRPALSRLDDVARELELDARDLALRYDELETGGAR